MFQNTNPSFFGGFFGLALSVSVALSPWNVRAAEEATSAPVVVSGKATNAKRAPQKMYGTLLAQETVHELQASEKIYLNVQDAKVHIERKSEQKSQTISVRYTGGNLVQGTSRAGDVRLSATQTSSEETMKCTISVPDSVKTVYCSGKKVELHVKEHVKIERLTIQCGIGSFHNDSKHIETLNVQAGMFKFEKHAAQTTYANIGHAHGTIDYRHVKIEEKKLLIRVGHQKLNVVVPQDAYKIHAPGLENVRDFSSSKDEAPKLQITNNAGVGPCVLSNAPLPVAAAA